MDATLRLQVVFGAIDRLTAPVRRLQAGAKGLSRDITATQRTLAGLKKQQADLASYKALQAQLGRTGARLDEAKARTARLREEVERAGSAPGKLAQRLAAAERAEKKATDAHEKHGTAAGEMAARLAAAGVQVDRLADHEADLGRRMADTTRQLERQTGAADRLERFKARGAAIRETAGKVIGAGAIATGTVSAPIVALLVSSIKASRESALAAAQAQAAVKSMENASGFSLEQLQAMAGALQDLSLFDDDDILQKVTANLLTFGNVAGDQFKRAQEMALNMAQRLGSDPQAATIQLGKALNNPAKGITALTKVGVAFTEQQKAQIRTMQASGNMAGAQNLILAELQKEFGGAAKAARDASPDAAMQQSWRGFQETLGALAESRLPKLIDNVNKLLDRFNNLSPASQEMILNVMLLAAAFGPVLTAVGGLITVIGAVLPIIGAIATALGVGALTAGIFVAAIVAFVAAIGYVIYRNWGAISGFVTGLWAEIKGAFAGGLTGIMALLWKYSPLRPLVEGVGKGIAWLTQKVPAFATIGRMMMEGLLSMLSPGRLVANIVKMGMLAISAFKRVLGIHSPSRVFAALGGHMTAGLTQGLDRGATAPMARLNRLGRQLTATTAAGALAAAPAGAGMIRSAGPATSAAAARTTATIGEVHIHVTQRPGEDAAGLARRIRDEVAALGRDDRRAWGSSYEDRD